MCKSMLLRTHSANLRVLLCITIFVLSISICVSQSYYDDLYAKRRAAYAYRNPVQVQQISNRLPNSNILSTSYAKPEQSVSTSASVKASTPSTRGKYRVSRADAENAKFAGANNQEAVDESPKTLHLKRRKLSRFRPYLNPCYPYGRDAPAADDANTTPAPKEQGRFLWDLNVYNVYPNSYGSGGGYGGGYGGGCGGYGYGYGYGGGLASSLGLGGLTGGLGGGLGGGLLSDPVAPAYPAYGGSPLNTFLGLFAPGILQNSLAVTARPIAAAPVAADPVNSEVDDLQTDPDVDPEYRPPPVRRRPNRVYFDSAGAPGITPAQLVGGVATTVNGIIQQLTGNIQPVYQSYRNSRSYSYG